MSSWASGISWAIGLLAALSGAGCGTANVEVFEAPDASRPTSDAAAAATAADAGSVAPDSGGAVDSGTGLADAAAVPPDAGAVGLDGGTGVPDAGPTLPLGDCASAPLRMTGTIRYYCDCQGGPVGCTPGDDGNDGLTPATPKRSLALAFEAFRTMPAGDTVALCRGGAWTGVPTNATANPNCTAAAPCEFRDYTPSWAAAGSPRPRIVAGAYSTMVFNSSSGGFQRIWNISIDGNGASASEGLIRASNGASGMHDVDVCNVELSRARIGVHLGATTRMTVRNSHLHDLEFAAVFGGDSIDALIDSNLFEGNGFTEAGQSPNTAIHSIYVGGTNTRVVNNEFANDTRPDGRFAGGVMLVFHDSPGIYGLRVENNYVHSNTTANSAYGISVSGGNLANDFRDIVVARNRVHVAWNSNAIDFNMTADGFVSDNIVTSGNLRIGNDGCGIDSTGTPDSCNRNVKVLNNVVHGRGIFQIGTANAADDPGYVIANNAIWRDTPAACITISAGVVVAVESKNYCRNGSGEPLEAVFVDAANGDFRPAPGGPLVGAGDSNHYSPTAIGLAPWSPADPGLPRSPPTDIGAMIH